MRAIAAILLALASGVTSARADVALDPLLPDSGYRHTESVGLISGLGPTGLFLNATSGILPKGAFSIESCMAFNENNGDHFAGNGVLVTYGVTDWLEISGYGLIVHGLDPAGAGSSDLGVGQVNARARLVRESEQLPELTLGGIVAFGDDPLVAHSLFLAASKGFTLSDRDFMRSLRVHAGIRETWPDAGNDVTTAFVGLELEVVNHLYMIGEVNTRDSSTEKTPWSAGLQYKGESFGLSAAVMQNPGNSRETYYVGIGVSY